ncbi:hypothetical protein EDB89DRAFT_429834 [Lactarius sanguifluus]|nr:hypothetical protein EDB89DRAFT_429834 [Lactarius sanguifluus]
MKPADGVKSFGSVAVQNGVSDAAVPCRPPHLSSAPSTLPRHPAAVSTYAASPVPKFDKKSIAKLFSSPSTQTVPSPATWSGYYYHPQFVPGVPPDPPSIALPPSTPSTANRPTSLVANASAFIPGKKITIKNPSGQEVDLDALKRLPPTVPIVPAVLPSPASVKKKKKKRLVLIESQKQRERRLAEEKAKEGESKEKDRINEFFANANEDATRRQIEEQEFRKVEERKSKEEAERTEKERKEAEERAEQERLRKLREEEDAKDAGTLADATSDAKPDPLPEDGEIGDEADELRRANTAEETLPNETASVLLPVPTSALATARPIEDLNRISYPEGIKNPKAELNVNAQKGRFRYDRDFLLQFMNICKERPDNLPLLDMIGKRPGPRNLQTTTTGGTAPALPSALRTARHIEDINRISYPEGIKNPRVQLDVNTQEGKFRAGTASVVPIEPLPSGPYMKSQFTPKTSRGPGASRPANFPGVGTGESETPDNSRRQNDDSFLQYGKYFFKDGNVTFLVDGFLYCVHRYLFSHGSVYFSTRFAQLGVRDHEALSTIVSLGNVEREDFEAFLSVLYPDFEERDLSYEQWRSVLYLSTRWGFASRRKLALESIKPPTPYDRLLLARQYAVDHWVSPALIALCERTAPLSLDEARGMNIEDLVLIATMREEIFRFGVSAAEIPRRIEAMQAEALVRVAGDDVSLASSKSKATEQGPGSMANATVDSDLEQFHGTKTVVTEPFKGKTPLSGWNLVSSHRRLDACELVRP